MQILKDHYHCIHKLNGVEGLEQARAELPDIIISDIMMPDMNGIEMTKKLKADINTSHIPIILLTAKATGEDKIQGLEAGATAYLTKPFNEEELLVRLHSTLDNQLKVQAHYSQYQVLPKDKPQENIFLQKVRETIVTKMGDSSLGILQICQAVNLERTQVYRKVKALTGMSPSQLIKDLRLRKAKELLLEKEKNVSEVAYECGFKDVSYFSKVFKEQFGVSPSKVDD
jgi:YesN/AraC family two-component response regulator